MILNNLLANLNTTPKIAEKIGKYFLKIANKKRNKDIGNNGDDDDDDDDDDDEDDDEDDDDDDDDDDDMYHNIKKYMKNI